MGEIGKSSDKAADGAVGVEHQGVEEPTGGVAGVSLVDDLAGGGLLTTEASEALEKERDALKSS